MNKDGCFTLAGACPLGGGWELAAITLLGQLEGRISPHPFCAFPLT